jgi:NADH-quinone oxidoreductase subunit N
MTLLSFAVMVAMGNNGGEQIEEYSGLARRSPFLAFALLIGMISLAGVPFTADFSENFLSSTRRSGSIRPD